MTGLAPLERFPGYLVGRDGHVYSVRLSSKQKRLAENEDRDGYVTVQVTYSQKSRVLLVHKLVARTFNRKPSRAGLQLRHYDGHKQNNCPENLKWGTAKQNAEDRERHGHTARGSKNRGGGNRLQEAQVRAIKRRLAAGSSTYAVASEFNISQSMAWFIKAGWKWRHVQ